MEKKSALLICTRQNSKWLCHNLKENGYTAIRKIIGKHNSLEVLEKRISNYSEHQIFLFDVSAVIEKGTDFVQALNRINRVIDSNLKSIVIYAPNMKPGNPILEMLVSDGFYNIVADRSNHTSEKTRIEICDLNDCLNKGLPNKVIQQYGRRAVEHIRHRESVQFNPPSYNNCYAELAFIGAGRVGKTSAALLTAAYFRRCKARVLFIFQNELNYEQFHRFYGFEKVKEKNYCGYIGFWYQESHTEEYIFFTAAGKIVEDQATDEIIEANFNIVIKDGLTDPQELQTAIPILVTAWGFSDNDPAEKVLEQFDSGIHAISFGDENAKDEYESKFDKVKHFLIPMAADKTQFQDSYGEGFAAVFEDLRKGFLDEIDDSTVIEEENYEDEIEYISM